MGGSRRHIAAIDLGEDAGEESIVERIGIGQTKQDRTIEEEWCQLRVEDLNNRRAERAVVFSSIGRETKTSQTETSRLP